MRFFSFIFATIPFVIWLWLGYWTLQFYRFGMDRSMIPSDSALLSMTFLCVVIVDVWWVFVLVHKSLTLRQKIRWSVVFGLLPAIAPLIFLTRGRKQ